MSEFDFLACYAHLSTTLGWTFEYIREHLTIKELKSLTEYWETFPPCHVILKAAYQIKGRSKEQTQEEKADLEIFKQSAKQFKPPVEIKNG